VGLLDALGIASALFIGRSTGGQIALAMAHQHPDRVSGLALLEPAVTSLDPRAVAWATALRAGVLEAGERDPSLASESVFRQALGDAMWEGWPDPLRRLFTAASPGVLAETRGIGLDLSEKSASFSAEELAAVDQPTLLVTAEDSHPALRAINERLAELLPRARHVFVPGDHLISPAHPVVLEFINQHVTSGSSG
jgi:pimeloyl-ACP methyl ester carboxylesterase